VSNWEFGGFGVGLWQASRMIELHGGTIRVESVPGQGATFVIELPRSGK
jgi:signal transduction histidine kinase